ncbi:hypothetical protein [Acinetobacter colistiniresistens]|uniref:hypothetical protein n=1 Tax=Acinetobacter colistiniresistens TaxID=280145 RepID=UPI0012509F88|nr:hypothetical protein [Acinetobacter colistiniresistens]
MFKKPRSTSEIIKQTNELARQFYAEMGYVETRTDFMFYSSQHPTERLMWKFACIAQLELTDTDPDELISEYEDEREQGE